MSLERAATEDRFFLCRLLPPRPSFVHDMTGDEAAIMQSHVSYWTELMAKGLAVVFGPVADPRGPWGLGIVRAQDDVQVYDERRPCHPVWQGLPLRNPTHAPGGDR